MRRWDDEEKNNKKRVRSQGYPIEQDALPGSPLASEEVGELDGENDGLLEGLLGLLQSGHIIPADVGLLRQDRALQ